MREPHFLVFNDQLIFSFFEAGTDPLAFEVGAWVLLFPMYKCADVLMCMCVCD